MGRIVWDAWEVVGEVRHNAGQEAEIMGLNEAEERWLHAFPLVLDCCRKEKFECHLEVNGYSKCENIYAGAICELGISDLCVCFMVFILFCFACM